MTPTRADLERLIETAIDDEPELPGPMPDHIRRAILDRPESVMRATVRATKEGIKARVRAALLTSEGPAPALQRTVAEQRLRAVLYGDYNFAGTFSLAQVLDALYPPAEGPAPTTPRYSGESSTAFWDAINATGDMDLYTAACRLQDAEARVLDALTKHQQPAEGPETPADTP